MKYNLHQAARDGKLDKIPKNLLTQVPKELLTSGLASPQGSHLQLTQVPKELLTPRTMPAKDNNNHSDIGESEEFEKAVSVMLKRSERLDVDKPGLPKVDAAGKVYGIGLQPSTARLRGAQLPTLDKLESQGIQLIPESPDID